MSDKERGGVGMMINTTEQKERFMEKVKIANGCWLWKAAKIKSKGTSYGVFFPGRKTVRAHRFSFEIFVGPIPSGLFVCHHCDNSLCVRPTHLFLGTAKDNFHDMLRKNRGMYGSKNPIRFSCRTKLTPSMVRSISRRHFSERQIDLANEFGVSPSTVRHVVRGETWKEITRK